MRAQALNRFDAISDSLRLLERKGLQPTCIVDAGANIGAFARMARSCFPAARIQMVEPQPACREALTAQCRRPGFFFHPFALVPQEKSGRKIGFVVAPEGITTGARIDDGRKRSDVRIVEVEARSLDDVIVPTLAREDRVLPDGPRRS